MDLLNYVSNATHVLKYLSTSAQGQARFEHGQIGFSIQRQ